MSKVVTLARLSWTERLVVVEAAVLLAGTRIVLWILPFRFYARGRQVHTSQNARGPTVPIPFLVRVIESLSRYVPKATCLVRAIALRQLMLIHGRPAELHFGVRKKAEDRLEAHAWVENEGKVVADWDDVSQCYTELRPATR